MLPVIYVLTSILVVITILRQRNPLTLTSFYGLGTVIYGCPLFLGFTLFAVSFQPLNVYCAKLDPRIYAMFWAAQGIYFLAVCCKRESRPSMDFLPSKLVLNAMTIVLAAGMVAAVVSLGPDVYAYTKAERMSRIGFAYFASSILASALLILYALSAGMVERKYLYLPLVFALLDLSLGFRQMFLIAGVVAIAYAEVQGIRFTSRSKARLVSIVLGVIVAALLYKPLYGALVAHTFDPANVKRYVLASILGNEPYAVAGTLNEALINEPTLPHGYALHTLVQYVPFYPEITRSGWTGFNSVCQSLFPKAEWSIASTTFGELYAVGGWIAISAFLLVQLLFLWSRPPRNPYLLMLYYHLGAYLLFYFYRNDWHYVIGVMRQYLVVAAMVWMVYGVLWLLYHTRQAHQQSVRLQET